MGHMWVSGRGGALWVARGADPGIIRAIVSYFMLIPFVPDVY